MTNAYTGPIKVISFSNLFSRRLNIQAYFGLSQELFDVYTMKLVIWRLNRGEVFSIHSFNLIYFHSCYTMSMIRKGTFKSFLHCLSLWTLNPFQHVLLNWQDVVFDATWVRQILMFNFHVKFLRSPKCLTYSHFLITKNFTFCRPNNLATHVLFFSSSHFCSHFNSTIYNIMILL